MDQYQHFKNKLALLETMLSRIKSNHSKVRDLRRSVHVLKSLLRDKKNIQSPYGPATAIVRFSRQ